ncbi:MAG: hypothetical protein J1F63_00655 [Oscillospiraceae bacterium]|nr:hypothetical protein [Oscillospiraceae bacterium]
MSMKSTSSADCVRRNYDWVMLNIKKGAKQELVNIANHKGLSLTAYIREAIESRYRADTEKIIDL